MDWANTNYDSKKTYEGQGDYYNLGLTLHRLDGPAIQYGSDDYCYEQYYFAGLKTSKQFIEAMVTLNKRVLALEEHQANMVVYETFVDALKNAMDDTQTDEVVVSRKMINAVIEHTEHGKQ